ncbi:hypothetical protein N7478_000004 [Penicillium angulare]|uniref:uncharacterized protein n=1 Tax=Penicillium angulare TaxID=116970 RepID=UPI00254008BD|nr:uncharacterized protein N7478_000004 [Penicillium angulare]KAJ5290753.1 hypothetical protein N7478_000004 [Penicillium angulare]
MSPANVTNRSSSRRRREAGRREDVDDDRHTDAAGHGSTTDQHTDAAGQPEPNPMPRRRESLTFTGPDAASQTVETVSELLVWIQNDPEAAWRMMASKWNALEQSQATLKEVELELRLMRANYAVLQEELQKTQDGCCGGNHSADLVDDLEEEYRNIKQQLESVEKERDTLAAAFRLLVPTKPVEHVVPTTECVSSTSVPPSPSPMGPIRSKTASSEPGSWHTKKVADPAMLSDGKEVRFEDWEDGILDKLELNADHYPTERHRMAYLRGRCEGKALQHINPRMNRTSATAYQNVRQVLDHLRGVFLDPNRAQLAASEYEILRMAPADDFKDFLALFSRLAEEARRPEEVRRRDLYSKLPTKIQNQVMMLLGRDGSMDDFVRECQLAASFVSQQQKFQKIREKDTKPSSSPATSTVAGTASTADVDKTKAKDERSRLMKLGLCFICKLPDHISRNCPTKVTVKTVAVDTPVDTPMDNKDMGKDYA